MLRDVLLKKYEVIKDINENAKWSILNLRRNLEHINNYYQQTEYEIDNKMFYLETLDCEQINESEEKENEVLNYLIKRYECGKEMLIEELNKLINKLNNINIKEELENIK